MLEIMVKSGGRGRSPGVVVLELIFVFSLSQPVSGVRHPAGFRARQGELPCLGGTRSPGVEHQKVSCSTEKA